MSAEVTQALGPLAVRLLLSAGGVASITLIAYKVIPGNPTTVAFAYLLFVLIVASRWGFVEACLSSILATLTFSLFSRHWVRLRLPPQGRHDYPVPVRRNVEVTATGEARRAGHAALTQNY